MSLNLDYFKTMLNGIQMKINNLKKPNWDQNDSSESDYIKGRTHYDLGSEKKSIIIKPDSATGKFYPPLALIPGETYNVYYGHKPDDLSTNGIECQAVDESTAANLCPSGVSACLYMSEMAVLHYDYLERLGVAFWRIVDPSYWKIEGRFSNVEPLNTKYLDADFRSGLIKMANQIEDNQEDIANCPTHLTNGSGALAIEQIASNATASYSVALGITNASSKYQLTHGIYNIEDDSDIYAHIVGNGTRKFKASNAHTLDWSGNAWFAGDVYVGSTSGTNKDDGSKKLATEEYVDGKISDKELILTSSTADSTKKFKITIDDSGTLSATEVTT